MFRKSKAKVSLIVLVLYLCSVFSIPVYGAMQEPLPDGSLNIDYKDGLVTLDWIEPTEDDTVLTDGYEIYIKNVTQKESYYKLKELTGAENTNYTIKANEYSFAEGQLYSFKVIPYHDETVTVADKPQTKRVTPSKEEEIILLTDIQVDTQVNGNKILVQWDDPSYENTDDILTYKLFYIKQPLSSSQEDDLSIEDFIEIVYNSEGEPVNTTLKSGVSQVTYSDIQQYSEEYKQGNSNADSEKMYYEIELDEEEFFRADENLAILVLPFTGEGQPVIENWAGLYFNDITLEVVPTIFTAIAPIELNLRHEDFLDPKYIQLIWAEDNASMIDYLNSYEIKLYAGTDPEELPPTELLKQVEGNKTIVAKPEVTTYYYIQITENGQLIKKSNVYEYNPESENWNLTSPIIPPIVPYIEPYTTQEKMDIDPDTKLNINKESSNYLIGVDDGVVIDDDGVIKDASFHMKQLENPTQYLFNLVWRSFLNGAAEDNMEYDIYITDQLENLTQEALEPFETIDVENISASENAKKIYGVDDETDNTRYVAGYGIELSKYQQKDENKPVQLKPITSNKWYYIKVLARLEDGIDEVQTAYTIRQIYISPDGEISVAPVITRPPLEWDQENTGENFATVKWQESWQEYYGTNDEGKEEWIYLDEEKKDELSDDDIIRDVTLGDNVLYYLGWIPKEDLPTTIQDQEKISFEDIKAYRIEGNEDVLLDSEIEEGPQYTIENLDPNTTYIFYLQAYRNVEGLVSISQEKKQELIDQIIQGTTNEDIAPYLVADPTPVYVTTDAQAQEPVPEEPITPYLLEDEVTDTMIRVKWSVQNPDFAYRVYIGDTDDFESAQESDGETVSSSVYSRTHEVNNLYPETTYYFWLEVENEESSYGPKQSNSLEITTDAFDTPDAPTGLGLRSYNGQPATGEHEADNSYITVEWSRDGEDEEQDEADEEVESVKQYSYVLEIADNKYFDEARTLEVTDENQNQHEGREEDEGAAADPFNIFTKSIVRINGLKANREYYIRVKTVVTVEPPDDEPIVKESEYSRVLIIKTRASDSEYDGDTDESNIVLPEEDYELIYEKAYQRLIYRLRSNAVDEDGKQDYHVDQRFITKLMKDEVYTLTIDVSQYKNYKIEERVVQIPRDIMKVLDERKVNLRIITDTLSLFIPHHSIHLQQAEYVDIQIVNWTSSQYQKILMPENYIAYSTIQQVNIGGKRNFGYDALSFTSKPIDITVQNQASYLNKDATLGAYIYDPLTNGIVTPEMGYTKLSNAYSFSTNRIGAYAILEKQYALTNYGSETSERVKVLGNKYNITDISSVYNSNHEMNHMQISNLLYGIALKKDKIVLNQIPNINEQEQMHKSGLSIKKQDFYEAINREEALTMLTNLYEIQTGMPIEVNRDSRNYIKDLKEASTQYQSALIKAWEIGLIQEEANPKENIKAAEVFNMVYQILQASGEI